MTSSSGASPRCANPGIRIAIDDFGTGHSPLSYLRNLPVDVLKVDKAFLDRVVTNEQDAALTAAILQMSAGMNLATVAEGVEDREQAGWLSAGKCLYGQGYLWSRPVPIDQARELLAGNPFEAARPAVAPDMLPQPRMDVAEGIVEAGYER